MRGQNIYNEIRNLREGATIDKKNCVFISHKMEDAAYCRVIADYLMSIGVDVYFDEYDTTINKNNPMSVVKAIERGIAASSSMLCVATPNTLKSKWVPWEIGNGFSKRIPLYVLRAKTLPPYTKVPEYMCVATYLKGWQDFAGLIAKLPHHRSLNESIQAFNILHPLYKYIDL